jgi:transposase
MRTDEILSTLYVGIDVSSRTNAVCALDFQTKKHLVLTVGNNNTGAETLAVQLAETLAKGGFKKAVIAMESTSIYSIHIASFLSTAETLLQFNAEVYCLNPKTTANYKKSYIDIGKTDPTDAFIIADFARVGRIDTKPWRGSQHLALQRLTRHRLHLAKSIAREKSYMLTNIFLKFSELAVCDKADRPFSDTFGATAEAVLRDFLTTDDIVSQTPQQLAEFVNDKGHKHFASPEKTAALLQQAARQSFRLDRCLYEPLTLSIASSFNCVAAFEKEITTIDKAIARAVKGLNPLEYQCLVSIPGIGAVYAAGILAEIGTIASFDSENALAKYAGLVWNPRDSGNFQADERPMSKAGNSYLRYYLIEAANSVKKNVTEYSDFYTKKYNEAKNHQHTRAIALTARKFIRLIFGLLDKNRLFSLDGART